MQTWSKIVWVAFATAVSMVLGTLSLSLLSRGSTSDGGAMAMLFFWLYGMLPVSALIGLAVGLRCVHVVSRRHAGRNWTGYDTGACLILAAAAAAGGVWAWTAAYPV